MRLAELRKTYEHTGPFATVYLEGHSHATEDAGQRMRLRWKALRDDLSARDADARVLEPVEARLRSGDDGSDQANGRVLVAEPEAGVVLDDRWAATQGAGDRAYWTRVPELGAYVRASARAVRMLVVLAGREGARLVNSVVTDERVTHETVAATVDGGGGTHHPHGGALSHNQIRRHADENAGRHAKDVAERLREATARIHPRVVVLAGDVQARTAIRGQLPDHLAGAVTEAEQGGGDRELSASLRDELIRIARDIAAGHAADSADRLNDGLAHDQAVQGHRQVARAAELGAVEALLLEERAPATREAFLLKVCAGTDSSVRMVPAGSGVPDGVAALLRHPLTGT